MTPNTRPTSRPAQPHVSASIANDDDDRGAEERRGGGERRAREHRGAGQAVARRAAAGGLGAEADQHAREQQDQRDPRIARERARQPAVALEASVAADEREHAARRRSGRRRTSRASRTRGCACRPGRSPPRTRRSRPGARSAARGSRRRRGRAPARRSTTGSCSFIERSHPPAPSRGNRPTCRRRGRRPRPTRGARPGNDRTAARAARAGSPAGTAPAGRARSAARPACPRCGRSSSTGALAGAGAELVTGAAGATVGVGVGRGAGFTGCAGAGWAGWAGGTGFAGCAGAGWAGWAGWTEAGGETGVDPLVPGWAFWSCSPEPGTVHGWFALALAQRRLDRGPERGVSSSMSGVISRSVRRYVLMLWSQGVERRVVAVVVVDPLGRRATARRRPRTAGRRAARGRHESPGQADGHAPRVPSDWYHSAPHEAPRHRRRRLHRLDRGRPAARRRPRRHRARQPLARPRAARSPRARARRRSTCSTPTRVRAALAGGFDGVLHFAALALVAESVAHPERYCRGNFVGTLQPARRDARRPACKRLVFSSTCAVYGEPDDDPDAARRADRPGQPLRRLQARGRPHDHRRVPRARARRASRCATSTSRARAATSARTTSPRPT